MVKLQHLFKSDFAESSIDCCIMRPYVALQLSTPIDSNGTCLEVLMSSLPGAPLVCDCGKIRPSDGRFKVLILAKSPLPC
jgi:hypothetical protein